MKLIITLSLLFLYQNSKADLRLFNDINDFKSNLVENLTLENCEDKLSPVNSRLEKLKIDKIYNSEIKVMFSSFLKNSFQFRLKLHDQLKILSSEGKVSEGCFGQIRNLHYNLRYIEENLAYITGDYQKEQDTFQGGIGYTLVNPKFENHTQLETGDILISRSNAVVSAAIAQAGIENGQFSHAAIVYRNPRTNKVFIIESHVETGTKVAPIEEYYIPDSKSRVVVLRTKDRNLAISAGNLMYLRASKAQKNNKTIPYDFKMNSEDEAELFCSEVPLVAYKKASQGKFILGDQYRTHLSPKNNRILQALGLSSSETFSPSDAEFDSKFEIVFEWRDLAAAYRIHRKDAVISKLYSWVESGELKLDTSQKSIPAHMAVFLRKFPIVGNFLKELLADNITTKIVKNMMMLDEAGQAIYSDLIHVLDSEVEYLNYSEILDIIEKLRVQDEHRLRSFNDWKRENPTSVDNVGMPEESHFMKYFSYVR